MCLFCCVDIRTDSAKATEDTTAGTEARIKVVISDCTGHHCVLHCHALWREEKRFPKNILDRAV